MKPSLTSSGRLPSSLLQAYRRRGGKATDSKYYWVSSLHSRVVLPLSSVGKPASGKAQAEVTEDEVQPAPDVLPSSPITSDLPGEQPQGSEPG